MSAVRSPMRATDLGPFARTLTRVPILTPSATLRDRVAGHLVASEAWRRTTEESLIRMSSKAASLGSSSRPGVMGELGERVLEAPLEERRQFGSEPEVESRVADGGELREAVVAILEGAEVALELDAEAQDHHPEEGDGVDLAFATDEFGLVGELLVRLGGEEAGERLLDLAGLQADGSHRAGGMLRHPIEVGAEV